jgi:RNA recognition motif-containing protein
MREKVEREGVVGFGNFRPREGKGSGFIDKLDKTTTSFYISNFPEVATTDELWKIFLKYGRVVEIYIPKKLDKRGCRFGFVKFKDVKEVEVLSDSMTDVWMGSFKLRVNRSRFARSEVKDRSSLKAPGPSP